MKNLPKRVVPTKIVNHWITKINSQNTPKTVKLILMLDEVDTLNSYSLKTNLALRSLFMGSFRGNLTFGRIVELEQEVAQVVQLKQEIARLRGQVKGE